VRQPAIGAVGAMAVGGILALCTVVLPAGAGSTTPSSSIISAGHGAVMPQFSVTVADSFGSMDGAFFRVSDAWRVDASFVHPTLAPWSSPGTCGIESMTDGLGHPIASAQIVNCYLRPTVSGFFNLRLETASASVPSPITVTFAAGVFTAPTIGESSQWIVGTVNNTDGGIPAPLNFNLVDLAVTPEAQYISCEQGVPMESAPLVPSGFTGTVSYDLLDDLPQGIIFDPTTGVISGTPVVPVPPQTVRIEVTSSSTGGSATVTVGLNVSDPSNTTTTTSGPPSVPTTIPAPPQPQTPALAATGFPVPAVLGAGMLLVLIGSAIVLASRRASSS